MPGIHVFLSDVVVKARRDSPVALIVRHRPTNNRSLVEIVIQEKSDQRPANGLWEHFPATDKHLKRSKRVLKDAYSGVHVRGISCLLES